SPRCWRTCCRGSRWTEAATGGATDAGDCVASHIPGDSTSQRPATPWLHPAAAQVSQISASLVAGDASVAGDAWPTASVAGAIATWGVAHPVTAIAARIPSPTTFLIVVMAFLRVP